MAITVITPGAISAATTAIIPALPAGLQADDVMLGIGESVGNEAYFSGGAPPTGWAHVTGSPVNVDTSTRLTAIWKRFVGGDVAVSWGDSGNHNTARVIAFRGVKNTGNPWNVNPAFLIDTAASPTATWQTVTTNVNDCLIVYCIATGRDGVTGAQMGAMTGGTGLTNITEQMDNWTALGTGGGIGMVTADKAVFGGTGLPTATMGSNDSKALMTIALEPAAVAVTPPPPLVMPAML